MRKGVKISRGAIGANISGQPWQISGLLTTGVDVVDGLQTGTVYTLRSLADAEGLGLDKAYDIDNNVVVYQHIVDFYDDDENIGLPFWLLVAPQTVDVEGSPVTVTIDDLVDPANDDYAKKLIIAANGAIYNLGVSFNPADDYTATLTDGINSDVRTAIAKAQALWQWSLDTFREIQIVLEGRNITSTGSAALDLAAIPATPTGIQQNHKVSIVIGQDWDFAETLEDEAQNYAGVGKMLATMSRTDLNQDVGEVETMNLTKETRFRWTTAGLSNHSKVKDVEALLDTLHAKQYIFADTYAGISGYRWNADFVCAPVVVDDQNNMNEHSIGLGRTCNHASRELRKKLLPQVRKVKPVDPATGKLSIGSIKYLEGKGNEVFEKMETDGHIVTGETIVDPDSDVQTEKLVSASFNLVAYSVIAEIQGTLNNKTRL